MAISSAPTSAPPLAFTRPSHHDGPDHIVTVDACTLRPLNCTCQAGRHGRLCWAVIEVTRDDLAPLAQRRYAAACGLDEITRAAHVLAQVRKWHNAARELAALRSCGYYPTSRDRIPAAGVQS